jgi:hypothetical protein
MGFEELFETRDKHPVNNRDEIYPGKIRYIDNSKQSFDGDGGKINWLLILEKIRNNKKLRIFTLLAGLLVLTIVIVLILILLPLIVKLVDLILQNGLQGILDEIIGSISRIIKGTGN